MTEKRPGNARFFWATLLAAAVLVIVAPPARPAEVNFRGVDYVVTSFDLGERISGVDYDPITGHLFLVDDRDDFGKTDRVYETDTRGDVVNTFDVPGAPYPHLRGLSVTGDTLTLVTNRAVLQMDKRDGSGFEETPTPDGAFNDFSGITYDPAGDIYYISRAGRGVYVTDGSFNLERLIDTPAIGYGGLGGIDFDPASGNLLLVDDGEDELLELTTTGVVSGAPIWLLDSEFPSRLSQLTSVAIDPATGAIYIAGRLFNDPSKVVVMTPAMVSFNGRGYSVSAFEFGERISGVDYDPATGHLFLVDDRDDFGKTDRVYETDAQGNVINDFDVPGAPYAYLRGLSVTGDTLTLVTNRAVLQMDKRDGSGFEETPTPDGAFNDFSGITYDPVGDIYYISRAGRGVYVTDGSFDLQRLIDTPAIGYGGLGGIDFDPASGNLLLADDGGDELLELTTTGVVSGEPIWLLDPEFPSPLSQLTSVAVDPATGTIYIAGRLHTGPYKIVVMRPNPAYAEGEPVVPPGTVLDEDSSSLLNLPFGSLGAPTVWSITAEEDPLSGNLPPGLTSLGPTVHFEAENPERYLGGGSIQVPVESWPCEGTYAVAEGSVLLFECREYWGGPFGGTCRDYVRAYAESGGFVARATGACSAVFNDIDHFSTYFAVIVNARGDLDGDGDVDRNDLTIVLQARRLPADDQTYGEGDDPRDLDGDGRISVLDARRLVLLCTRPRCALAP